MKKVSESSIVFCVIIFLVLMMCAGVLISADWNVPATANFPVWSGPKTVQITSGSRYNTMTIDGKGYTKEIILGTSNLYTCNAQITLVNNSTQSYYESSITAISTNDPDVCFTISKPIGGIVTAGISLSAAATTGGKYGTLNFLMGKE